MVCDSLAVTSTTIAEGVFTKALLAAKDRHEALGQAWAGMLNTTLSYAQVTYGDYLQLAFMDGRQLRIHKNGRVEFLESRYNDGRWTDKQKAAIEGDIALIGQFLVAQNVADMFGAEVVTLPNNVYQVELLMEVA